MVAGSAIIASSPSILRNRSTAVTSSSADIFMQLFMLTAGFDTCSSLRSAPHKPAYGYISHPLAFDFVRVVPTLSVSFHTGLANSMLVGMTGFEPMTFCPPDRRSSQAEPHPVKFLAPVERFELSKLLVIHTGFGDQPNPPALAHR